MYLRGSGIDGGPYTESDARARFDARELSGSVMSWIPGEPQWQSLANRWGGARAKHRRVAFQSWCLCIVGAGLALLGPVYLFGQLSLQEQHGRNQVLITATGLVVALAGVLRYWHATRQASSRSIRAGAVRCSLATAALATYALVLLPVRVEVAAGRFTSPNGEVAYDPDLDAISIRGPIGILMPRDLMVTMTSHPDTKLILLESGGGLVDEALEIAEQVAGHRMTVRVEHYCASACVTVWAASPTRQLAPDAELGLHEGSLDLDIALDWILALKQLTDTQVVTVLRRAGFSSKLLAKREEVGESGMYWLSAIAAFENGVQFDFVDVDGAVVDIDHAKWLWAQDRFEEYHSAREALAAAAREAPRLRAAYGPELYAAVQSGELEALGDVVAEILREAADDASRQVDQLGLTP